MQCQGSGPPQTEGHQATNFAEVSNLASSKIKAKNPPTKTEQKNPLKIGTHTREITQAYQDDALAHTQTRQKEARERD